MAVVLVTAAGDAAANSYASLAEASAWFEPTGFSAAWEGMPEQERIKRLVEAARALDRFGPFAGVPSVSGQALAFPRLVPEGSDLYVDPATIPAAAKRAQLELVVHLWRTTAGATSFAAVEPALPRGLTRFKAGEIDMEFDPVAAPSGERQAVAGGNLEAAKAALGGWLRRGMATFDVIK